MRAWLYTKWTLLKDDRGEGPVPHIVMVALMVGVAIVVATGIGFAANAWLSDLNSQNP